MSIHRDLEHAVELATRVLNAVESGLIGRITDCQHGHPSAARWDLERSSGTPVCWVHERDLRDCHEAGSDCLADDVISGPSDPTGSAAVRPDVAAGDLDNLTRAAQRFLRDAQLMADIDESYPAPHAANAYERELTSNTNDPHCESCYRIEGHAKGQGWWQEIHPNLRNRTTVANRLKEPMYLCKFCYEHVAERGCLPNDDELSFRKKWEGTNDKRVPCPHPKLKEAAA